MYSTHCQIYEWGGEGYDGLGDKLDEAGDDFNDDTFGIGAGDVGKDFDFGHGPSTGAQPQRQQPKPVDSMFASNFDDFWAVPSFGKPQQQQPQQPQAPLQPPQPQPQPPARRGKTMEEIEAELRAASLQQQQQPQPQPQSQPQPPPTRRPLTMEEIEAEMRSQQAQAQQAQAPLPPPGVFPPGAMPPNLVSMMQQSSAAPPAAPRGEQLASDFPPLGSAAPPTAGRPGTPGQGPPLPLPRGMSPQVQGAPAPAPPLPPMQQAEHFARMRAMLAALPDRVQQALTSLPPHMHFDVLQGVCREFPILLEPSTPAIEERHKMAQEAALGRFRMIGHFDRKRIIREAKIASMAPYNNLMTVSDKEFITRIQISQIITADPYADDFYAHIYFALRGRPGPNPGLMGAQPQPQQVPTQPQQQQQRASATGKAAKNKQPKMNAQQKAMLRMQQQVERLVADRKQRIEKAALGTNPNLAGALGKVGINVAGNPRQALQINSSGDAAGKTSAGGTAADAVRQALEGASLGGTAGSGNDAQAGGEEQRAPLTRHETLRILERLYDIVLNLEQLRRSEGGEGESTQQEELTAALWKELRVLEPLGISDPHPFVSLLSTIKGKRLLPRALRHLSSEQTLTALTMIVASFDSLDVVREAHYLDDVSSLVPGANAPNADKKHEVEAQAECFSNSIVPAMLVLMSSSPMRIVIGMLALFVERNDVVKVVRSRAGIAFLTILLSRAESLRQAAGSTGESDSNNSTAPTQEEQAQWSSIFQLLFERLVTGSGGLNNLFPSTRAKSNLPFGISFYHLQPLQSTLDELDKDVWNLYAALAVSSTMEQQSILVQELREKILENVLEARGKSDSLEGQRKLRLVNIFLNALNLDASQITV